MMPNAPGVLRDASGRRVCRVEQAVDVVAHDAVDPQATQASDVRSTLRVPREDEQTDGMHQPDASCREYETHFRSHRPGNAPPPSPASPWCLCRWQGAPILGWSG